MFPRLSGSQSVQQLFLQQLKQDLANDPLLERVRWLESDVRRRINHDLEALRESRKRFPAFASPSERTPRIQQTKKRGRKRGKELYVFRKTQGNLGNTELQKQWESIEQEYQR